MRMRVGSADVGGLIEIVEFDEPADMAWTSITGIDQRGRWRLRETADGRTKVTLRLSYDAPGGMLGPLTDRLAAPMVRRTSSAPSQSARSLEGGRREWRERGKGVPERVGYAPAA